MRVRVRVSGTASTSLFTLDFYGTTRVRVRVSGTASASLFTLDFYGTTRVRVRVSFLAPARLSLYCAMASRPEGEREGEKLSIFNEG